MVYLNTHFLFVPFLYHTAMFLILYKLQGLCCFVWNLGQEQEMLLYSYCSLWNFVYSGTTDHHFTKTYDSLLAVDLLSTHGVSHTGDTTSGIPFFFFLIECHWLQDLHFVSPYIWLWRIFNGITVKVECIRRGKSERLSMSAPLLYIWCGPVGHVWSTHQSPGWELVTWLFGGGRCGGKVSNSLQGEGKMNFKNTWIVLSNSNGIKHPIDR